MLPAEMVGHHPQTSSDAAMGEPAIFPRTKIHPEVVPGSALVVWVEEQSGSWWRSLF